MEIDQYLVFAKHLADQAGAIMLDHFQVGVANDTKEDEGDTPVTAADKAINSLVIDAVSKRYPTHAVIGEEESLEQKEAEFIWVCDPIDGTIPYVMGVPTNVFSLALVDSKNGQPVIAVVYDPYMKRKYWATKNGGAFMNNKPIRVNEVAKLPESYVGISGSRSRVVNPSELKAEVISTVYRPVLLNCTVYEAMMVASGQIAATIYLGRGAHDVASSKLIVEEAGGKVTDVFGDEQRYDNSVRGTITSNSLVHGELVRMANKHKL